MNGKMLWGSATASYQCEGAWNEDGKVESMWDHYLHQENLENGDVASDHYHRFREDIRQMAEGGQNAYRFSLSWPRIIKNESGEINEKGLDFYRQMIDACHENGIEPFVTCYHWDLPQYLEEKGGWLNKATAAAFQHYCEVVFKAFNGLVDHWTTFNEPKWFVFSGYMSGNYPPCHKNPQEVVNVAYNVMYANALAVKSFKELGILGSIGIVTSYQTIYGIDDSEACQLAFRNADNYCNNWIIDTACSGAFPSDMVAKLAAEGFDLSIAQPEELQLIKNNTVQFLGMNYYSPQFVKPYTGGETDVKVNNLGKNYKGNMRTVVKNWFEVANDDMTELPRNDWGMIIYPQGLREGLRRNSAKFSGPIYVTENGFGNYEDIHNGPVHDQYRIEYIREHVRYLLKAQSDGVDVRGYFVWSPFDLYSWKNGCEKRYGLVAVDFDHGCKRIPKDSYYWYRDEIASNWLDVR